MPTIVFLFNYFYLFLELFLTNIKLLEEKGDVRNMYAYMKRKSATLWDIVIYNMLKFKHVL